MHFADANLVTKNMFVAILHLPIYLRSKKKKVVHRDVKPSNILLGHDGSIKVCDFGVSKTMVQTMMNTNVGCERYLPPERLDPTTSRSPYDVTSDVRNAIYIFWKLDWTILTVYMGGGGTAVSSRGRAVHSGVFMLTCAISITL